MVGQLAVGQALAGLGTQHVVKPELGAHLHAVLLLASGVKQVAAAPVGGRSLYRS